MSIPDLKKELRIQRQIAFDSGLFQGDVTVHTLLESFAEGVVIIDNSGTILLVNTSTEQMFGYPKEELNGCTQLSSKSSRPASWSLWNTGCR